MTLLRKTIIIPIVMGFIAHWPSLLSDSKMWDDWNILSWTIQNRADWVFQFFHNYGVTPYFIVYFPLTFIQDAETAMFLSKLIYFFGIIINAILVMFITKKIVPENPLFVILSGISMIFYPSLSGEGFHPTTLSYYFFVPLFFIGLLLFIITASSNKFNLLIRITSLFTLFLSFSLNSLLVMFYGLVPTVMYVTIKKNKFINLKNFIIRHIDFLLLPIIFWIIKEIFMPRKAIYARYNKIILDWNGILLGYKQLMFDIINTIILTPFSIKYTSWIAITIFIVMLLKIKLSSKNNLINQNITPAKELLILLITSSFALFCAAFPYYMIGRRSFVPFGFLSRDNILFPLPVSWIIAILFCFILKAQLFIPNYLTSFKRIYQKIIIGIFIVLISSQSISNWRNHLDWQAHYAYYRSIINVISKNQLVKQSSVIHIIDQIPGDRTLRNYRYPTSVWTNIMSVTFLNTTRLAIPHTPKNGRFFSKDEIKNHILWTEMDFMFNNININGQQIRITATPNKKFNPTLLALEYWKNRFIKPHKMSKFLNSLTNVTIEPITVS